MAQCPGSDHNLAPVVRLVSYEIGEDVSHVERKIAPDVGRDHRDPAALLTAQGEQAEDTPTAPLQGRHQLPTRDAPSIDAAGHGDPLFLAQGLDPHAPGVVHVACDHPDRPARRPRHGSGPQHGRQVLDQEDGHPIVGAPGVEDRLPEVRNQMSPILSPKLAARLRKRPQVGSEPAQ